MVQQPQWLYALRLYLAALVVQEDVAGDVVLQVGDLKAVGVANLLWLEAGIYGVHLNCRFWFPGLVVWKGEQEAGKQGCTGLV